MILKNFNAKKLSVAQMKTLEGGNANGFPGTPFSDEVIGEFNGKVYTRQDIPFFGFTDEQISDYMSNVYKNPPLRG
ncbi:hypothetical protein D1632_08650 [Chryseobacterium nematophagum]|uniref:Bacteriocin n=1 Tax=Chryseobacterium nematophagum TaxID=2305228 RepID=A0A3M7LAB0_9FLAO|nr:hypothetical protein [Chryseobacterium nematophagum]RMZ59683.1 hypothetical protein D1632_08650 [Chryseobacterium nematophagum]